MSILSGMIFTLRWFVFSFQRIYLPDLAIAPPIMIVIQPASGKVGKKPRMLPRNKKIPTATIMPPMIFMRIVSKNEFVTHG